MDKVHSLFEKLYNMPFDQAVRIPLTQFFQTYSLHDSRYTGVWADDYDTVIMAFKWDMAWQPNGIFSKTSTHIDEWPNLIIKFDGVKALNLSYEDVNTHYGRIVESAEAKTSDNIHLVRIVCDSVLTLEYTGEVSILAYENDGTFITITKAGEA